MCVSFSPALALLTLHPFIFLSLSSPCPSFPRPIHDAVEANDLAGVKLLVEYGASIAPESGERLPLEIAKSKGFLSIVEYLQGVCVCVCVCVCVSACVRACVRVCCSAPIMYQHLSPLELMDISSRDDVKSAKGHTSQFVSSGTS